MSNYKKAPSEGDRIDLGGKLPQFKAFSWFVYQELIKNNLHWIRIGDPEALKLDDIQFSTKTEINAYQVKWSNQVKLPNFTFREFAELLPEFVLGWESLKLSHQKENKTLRIILLTNRPLSDYDQIEAAGTKLGSFKQFYIEAWLNLKLKRTIPYKWKRKLLLLQRELNLNTQQAEKFIECLEIINGFQLPNFELDRTEGLKQKEDNEKLLNFILEEISSNKKNVHFAKDTLIQKLGWQTRFKTTFQHDFTIDDKKYQPIEETIDLLNTKLNQITSGYLFLNGGPGSGKSTLLNQWSKERIETVIKYYAFDFTNPHSAFNIHERGEAESLYYDLIITIKDSGIYTENILPFKDLNYLRSVLFKQLSSLSDKFKRSGEKTLIIIDGLDHIPREYTQAKKSLLAYLPKPLSVPEGIIFILGSQTFDLEDLDNDIKIQSRDDERKLSIAPLSKPSILNYLITAEIEVELSEEQKNKIYDLSQGHPLYLTYITEKLKVVDDLESFLNSAIKIDGNIANYYEKLWLKIDNNSAVIELLGLMSRLQGKINPNFILEWGYERESLKDLKLLSGHLFDISYSKWNFFHNSFLQFVIRKTALNVLTNDFDEEADKNYHKKLALYYFNSKVENSWKELFHLFKGKEFDAFIQKATPAEFENQLIHFRSPEEIENDIRLGIELARIRNDYLLLVRYLFALSEIQQRLQNLHPVSLTEELFSIGMTDQSMELIRSGNELRCNKKYALKISRVLYQMGDLSESKLLFKLAEPDEIKKDGIKFTDDNRYNDFRDTLIEWTQTAYLFYPSEKIIHLIKSIELIKNTNTIGLPDSSDEIKHELFFHFGLTLIGSNRLDEIEIVLKEYKLDSHSGKYYFFNTIKEIIESLVENEIEKAKDWLAIILENFSKESCNEKQRIQIADIVYKATGNIEETTNWLNNVNQPPLVKPDNIGFEDSLDAFLPLIKFNKLLNICNKGVSILDAVPNSSKKEDTIIVSFERSLCLITQILSEGITGNRTPGDIVKRCIPIISFYYKDVSHNNLYRYRLEQAKGSYLNFLIYSVSLFEKNNLDQLGDYLFLEFIANKKHWSPTVKRKVLVSLLENGFDKVKIANQTEILEGEMLIGDISSRIDECQKQSQLWIKLGFKDKAQVCLKNAIRESLGVGYRKDYQMSNWIEWLKTVNLKEPQKAKERIQFFLSSLEHLKESTEGRAYLQFSEELLVATFDWNYACGVEQMIWQLNNGLIHFEDALNIYISESIKNSKSIPEFQYYLNVFTDIFLFISESGGAYLLRVIINKGISLFGKEFLKNNLSKIVFKIGIKALEEKRDEYYSVIWEFFDQVEFSPEIIMLLPAKEDLKKENKNSYSETLLLIDEERIDESDVKKLIASFEDLERFITNENKANSYFNWSGVINSLPFELTSEQIKKLDNQIAREHRATELYSCLASLAVKVNDWQLAKDLGLKALKSSNSSGWDSFYDGGSRIKAFEIMHKVDPKKSFELGFNTFISDILNSSYAGSYVRALDKILPIISESYNPVTAWQEIESYLTRLMANSKSEVDLPAYNFPIQSVANFDFRFPLFLCQLPVNCISYPTKYLLAKLIIDLPLGDLEQFKTLANENEEGKELFVSIAMYLNEIDSSKLNLFESEFHILASSENYFVRRNVIHFLSIINKSYSPPKISRILSPVYGLHLDSSYDKPNFGYSKEDMPYYSSIKAYGLWITVLSEESFISKEILEYRFTSLMRSLDIKNTISDEANETQRSLLNEIRLRFHYSLKRALVAKNALFHLFAELVDAEKINANSLNSLFNFFDPKVELITPIQKPNLIPSIKKTDRESYKKEWVAKIDSSFCLKSSLTLMDDWVVIAQDSVVKNLNWGTPTEYYSFMLSPSSKKKNLDNGDTIFPDVYNSLINNYPKSFNSPKKELVLINRHYFHRFDIKSKWLAFNSNLAFHLGWKKDDKELFGWKDENGVSMVKSIFWQNGNTEILPPHLESEVGEGWVVLASKKGFELMVEELPSLNSHALIEREFIYDGETTKDLKYIVNKVDL